MLVVHSKDLVRGHMVGYHISPHVHQPLRNTAPNGNVYGSEGSKTTNGGVTSPSSKDFKQLYEYLINGKYHE